MRNGGKSDLLAEIIAARQYFDLREFRFEPMASPALGRLLADMAGQIVEAMERECRRGRPSLRPCLKICAICHACRDRRKSRCRRHQPADGKTRPDRQDRTAHAYRRPAPRGDFLTVSDALAAAKPGDRIVVRPGFYREGIVIDKVVEIIGDGDRERITIEAANKDTVLFKAPAGRIANLTLRQAGGGLWDCVDIRQGRLNLEDCDISSQARAAYNPWRGRPWLRSNRIHDCEQGGILVDDNGQGVLEDNEIFANALSGIAIREGGNPTVRRNRIHDGKKSGIYVYENGQGVLEDNEIFANALSGIAIKEGGNPTVRRNRIHDGKQSGIMSMRTARGCWKTTTSSPMRMPGSGSGRAAIRPCGATASTMASNRHLCLEERPGGAGRQRHLRQCECRDQIKEGGNPTVRRNRITDNGYEAVWVYEGGRGTFEGNDLRGNKRGAWDIAADCADNISRKDNQE